MLHPNEDAAAVVASGHYWHEEKVAFHALQLRLCFWGTAGQKLKKNLPACLLSYMPT